MVISLFLPTCNVYIMLCHSLWSLTPINFIFIQSLRFYCLRHDSQGSYMKDISQVETQAQSEDSNWRKKNDKHKAMINNILMMKKIMIMWKQRKKCFIWGCMCGVCNIKERYDNEYQKPIEFIFYLLGYSQQCHAFWISSPSYIIVSSMVGLPFRFSSNNLGVIQLDSGYFLLASSLFTLQFLSLHSFLLSSASCCFYKPWVALTVF